VRLERVNDRSLAQNKEMENRASVKVERPNEQQQEAQLDGGAFAFVI